VFSPVRHRHRADSSARADQINDHPASITQLSMSIMPCASFTLTFA
jgi:hypothetical protein